MRDNKKRKMGESDGGGVKAMEDKIHSRKSMLQKFLRVKCVFGPALSKCLILNRINFIELIYQLKLNLKKSDLHLTILILKANFIDLKLGVTTQKLYFFITSNRSNIDLETKAILNQSRSDVPE